MADDYNWDDFDAQTAEYLTSDPTWSNYDWSPDQSSWLSDYTAPLFPSDTTGSTGDISSVLGNINLLQQLAVPEYGQSLASWAESPLGTSLLNNPLLRPDQSFVLDDGTVVGDLSSGADVQNPYRYVQSGDSTFIVDDNTGQPVGYLGDDGQLHTYQESRLGNTLDQSSSKPSVNWSQRAKDATAEAMARAYEARNRQAAAKDAYSRSGVGQAMTGLQGALAVAQALMGKNKGVATSARGNQGQAFAPTYIGSSAPKTKYARGGEVKGGLLNLAEQMAHMMASQKGLIPGEAGGQDDVVDIKAAPGEYIMDADVVSSLGDGNNAEGAKKLDQMRINIRKHKRGGGLSDIPPKAKKPEQYLKGK